MMKKTIYAATTVGALAFGGIVFANTDSAENPANQALMQPSAVESQNTDAKGNMLSFEEASKKALEIANGTVTDIELDNNRNNPHYEVDIYHDGYEYDVKVDAASGEILQQKREKDDKDDDAEKAVAAGNLISSEEAIKAAQTVAKGRVTDIELDDEDDDNGAATYEIEMKDGKTEHEISVNATTGEVLNHESDKDNDDNDDDNDD